MATQSQAISTTQTNDTSEQHVDEATSATAPRPLPTLRTLIDEVDVKLVHLLNERAKLVMEVGRRKIADGTPVYAPHREQAVLARALRINTGPLLNVTLEAIYREIMSGSFALERPLRIGYLGPQGSFCHEAANKQFGRSVSYENLRTIAGVFEEVARGHVDYGLVPIENASIGSVTETQESFLLHAGRVSVCAEVHLSIAQALIATPGAAPSDIRTIYSKSEALAQCRMWLSTQYPHAELVSTTSTSAAVEAVANAYKQRGTEAASMAAIGSRLAATLYDLPVMFPEVQDVTPNTTRFLVLCAASTAAAVSASSGNDKTSLLFVCADEPGALRDILDAFAREKINLTHIDKRPCPPPTLAHLISIATDGTGLRLSAPANEPDGHAEKQQQQQKDVAPGVFVSTNTGGRGSVTLPFVYVFFVEAAAHVTSPMMQHALRDAAQHCVCLKILGSFPAARRVL